MPETVEPAELYSAIEESARLLDIPCSRDKVWPVLTAYADVIPKAVTAFRLGTGARYAGDLDWRFLGFTLPEDTDPYTVALSNGLIAPTDHPSGVLLSQIREHCGVGSFGVDFGVVGGFKKAYAFFPPNGMQRLSTLADIPAMPRGVAENLDYFERYGLGGDKVNLFGIDYPHRSVNVYFGGLPEECLEPKTIVSMVRDLDLPDPSEAMVRLGEKAFGIYVSLNWQSARVERFCYAVMTPNAGALPVPIEPRIEQLLRDVPYSSADDRFIYYAGTSAAGEENYKIQAYFNWNARMLNQMLLSDSGSPDEHG